MDLDWDRPDWLTPLRALIAGVTVLAVLAAGLVVWRLRPDGPPEGVDVWALGHPDDGTRTYAVTVEEPSVLQALEQAMAEQDERAGRASGRGNGGVSGGGGAGGRAAGSVVALAAAALTRTGMIGSDRDAARADRDDRQGLDQQALLAAFATMKEQGGKPRLEFDAQGAVVVDAEGVLPPIRIPTADAERPGSGSAGSPDDSADPAGSPSGEPEPDAESASPSPTAESPTAEPGDPAGTDAGTGTDGADEGPDPAVLAELRGGSDLPPALVALAEAEGVVSVGPTSDLTATIRVLTGTDPENLPGVVEAVEIEPFEVLAEVSPNGDPDTGNSWWLRNPYDPEVDTGALQAWNRTRGRGVTVAVLDDGVDTGNPDLVGALWSNPGESCGNGDADRNGYHGDCHGWNFVTNSPDLSNAERNGRMLDVHGTMVSAMVAESGWNQIGTLGMAPGARVMPLVVGKGGYIRQELIARAIVYAVDEGARVINGSFIGMADSFDRQPRYPGGESIDDQVRAAMEYAQQEDVVLVFGAGNDSANRDQVPGMPANAGRAYGLDNVISVGASTYNDDAAEFSAYGPTTVDLHAPGASIWVPTVNPRTGGRTYVWADGTSLASPMTAAAAALVQSIHPGASAAQVKQILLDSATRPESLAGRSRTGGRLNVAAAAGSVAPTYTTRFHDLTDMANGTGTVTVEMTVANAPESPFGYDLTVGIAATSEKGNAAAGSGLYAMHNVQIAIGDTMLTTDKRSGTTGGQSSADDNSKGTVTFTLPDVTPETLAGGIMVPLDFSLGSGDYALVTALTTATENGSGNDATTVVPAVAARFTVDDGAPDPEVAEPEPSGSQTTRSETPGTEESGGAGSDDPGAGDTGSGEPVAGDGSSDPAESPSGDAADPAESGDPSESGDPPADTPGTEQSPDPESSDAEPPAAESSDPGEPAEPGQDPTSPSGEQTPEPDPVTPTAVPGPTEPVYTPPVVPETPVPTTSGPADEPPGEEPPFADPPAEDEPPAEEPPVEEPPAEESSPEESPSAEESPAPEESPVPEQSPSAEESPAREESAPTDEPTRSWDPTEDFGIVSIDPNRGYTVGGDMVTIEGTNLPDNANVLIGSRPGTVLRSSRSRVVFLTPAYDFTGPQDIWVFNSDGSRYDRVRDAYTYIETPGTTATAAPTNTWTPMPVPTQTTEPPAEDPGSDGADGESGAAGDGSDSGTADGGTSDGDPADPGTGDGPVDEPGSGDTGSGDTGTTDPGTGDGTDSQPGTPDEPGEPGDVPGDGSGPTGPGDATDPGDTGGADGQSGDGDSDSTGSDTSGNGRRPHGVPASHVMGLTSMDFAMLPSPCGDNPCEPTEL